MLVTIYWISATLVMLAILVLTIRDYITRSKRDKEFEKINEMIKEYYKKQLEEDK